MPQNLDWTQLLVAVVAYKLIELLVASVYKKMAGNHYVTRKDCESCAKQGDSAVTKLTGEVATIKGILLVIAVRADIPPEQLAKLTQ